MLRHHPDQGAFIALLIIAAVSVVGLYIFNRSRRTRFGRSNAQRNKRPGFPAPGDVALLCLAAFLMVGGFISGLKLLGQRSAPATKDQNIGFVPPVPGNGIVLGMAVRTDGCRNPVRVTVTAGGTAEYWRRHARTLAGESTFRFAVPNEPGEVRHIRLGVGRGPNDLTAPADAEPQNGGLAPGTPSTYAFRTMKPSSHSGVVAIPGAIDPWNATALPFVTTFDADWLRKRGLGSCFLVTPGLVGPGSLFAAQVARHKTCRDLRKCHLAGPYFIEDVSRKLFVPPDQGLVPSLGSTTVLVRGGQVLDDTSRPHPDSEFRGHPKWTCEYNARGSVGTLGTRNVPDTTVVGSGLALSKAALQREASSTCAGIVAIQEASAGTKRDLILLLMGAVISLGAALAIELLLEWRRKGIGRPI